MMILELMFSQRNLCYSLDFPPEETRPDQTLIFKRNVLGLIFHSRKPIPNLPFIAVWFCQYIGTHDQLFLKAI